MLQVRLASKSADLSHFVLVSVQPSLPPAPDLTLQGLQMLTYVRLLFCHPRFCFFPKQQCLFLQHNLRGRARMSRDGLEDLRGGFQEICAHQRFGQNGGPCFG